MVYIFKKKKKNTSITIEYEEPKPELISNMGNNSVRNPVTADMSELLLLVFAKMQIAKPILAIKYRKLSPADKGFIAKAVQHFTV